MFCKHNWELLAKEIIPSVVDKLMKELDNFEPDNRSLKGSFSDEMYSSTTVIICKCTKCGKLDKTIVKSPQ
jgi:hypothetical protein